MDSAVLVSNLRFDEGSASEPSADETDAARFGRELADRIRHSFPSAEELVKAFSQRHISLAALPSLGMCIALCLVGVHLWLATDRTMQLKLLVIAAGVGLAVDSVQLWGGVFVFPNGVVVEWLPPPWMSVLWMQFATTFQYSMRWLSCRYMLSACFGFAGAPLAFFAGERLGAVEFLPPRLMHYAVLAIFWSVAVPLLVYISDQAATRRRSAAASYRWLTRPEKIRT